MRLPSALIPTLVTICVCPLSSLSSLREIVNSKERDIRNPIIHL
jgi:hypothetical protein